MDTKEKNFERISTNRVEKIINLLEQLTNLTNTSFYEYSDEQINSIFKVINDKSAEVQKKLIASNNKKTKKIKI